MHEPPKDTIIDFAAAFAGRGKGKGLTRVEILDWFRSYSRQVVDPANYGLTMNKAKLFGYCLSRLPVERQYQALIDICRLPPATSSPLPSESRRDQLLERLFAARPSDAHAARLLRESAWSIQRQWLKAISRLEDNPAAAITSARTMLETAAKGVLASAGVTDTSRGNLAKLARLVLDNVPVSQPITVASRGITQLVNALAESSNSAGDRHGTVEDPDDGPSLAETRFFVDLAASLTLLLLEVTRAPDLVTAPANTP